MNTPEEISSWIASVAGGSVRSLQRVGYGASRATFVAEIDGTGDLVARVDTGDGPMAGTELSLEREAEIYRALAGTGVRIPALHAVSPDRSALLADRVPGTHEVDALADQDRFALYDDYLDAIAELHVVDAATLDLPSFRHPQDGPSHATCELDLWGGILATRTARPWPLAHYALSLLRCWAPTEVTRTVVCHGDVGPGNFMHDGRRVTALLDWEFCHLGDPMDDLGWWVFRGHDMAGGCGDLAAQLRRWSARTGLPVDARRVDYYRAFVMLRWLISISAPLDAETTTMDRSVYFGLLPVLSVRLPAALAALAGIDLGPPPEIPDDASPGPAEPVLRAMWGDLTDVIAPDLRSPDARRRAGGAMLYLAHLSALDRLGPTLAAADDDDLAEVLGRRPSTGPARERDLAAAIAGGEPSVEVLRYFWRNGVRQAALWPPVVTRALGAPTLVPDDGAGTGTGRSAPSQGR
jgi:aminoglycoside phosphotransferase (APT) family kinase protein